MLQRYRILDAISDNGGCVSHETEVLGTRQQGQEQKLQLALHQIHKDISPAVQHPFLGLVDLQAGQDAGTAPHHQPTATVEGLRQQKNISLMMEIRQK